jgi:RimJ/RimL family protein N-acetyltransferase
MRNYLCLSQSIFQENSFSLVPIREEDLYEIMKMRNEQMYHLRQSKLLTVEDQEHYFKNVVATLFENPQPNQLLFSFFRHEEFIGYGGLVHINWIDRNAEISFIMKTELEQDNFDYFWINYLSLLDKLAFQELNFHKIYTYAFDLRPHLYTALVKAGFKEDARLKEHCFFEGKFLDVVLHSKYNRELSYRKAKEKDLMLYFDWTNDVSVRENSYRSESISIDNHTKWFLNKIVDVSCLMLVFEDHIGKAVGQVRIEKKNKTSAIIGISNDINHRGKGYASQMIQKACEVFFVNAPLLSISAYIKIENKGSERAFQKAGFVLESQVEYEGYPSYHYIKKL